MAKEQFTFGRMEMEEETKTIATAMGENVKKSHKM